MEAKSTTVATAEVGYRHMANAIRALSMDAVEKAKSGHPGMPMGMADVATVLFRDFLVFDPKRPDWPNRDRFVLSAGHGSMLLYSLLYLTGYDDITIDQIKNFRQLGSRTPGHPEYGCAQGVETTTGPLGQGFANAVGMAMAERMLAAQFGEDLFDHYTYVLAGDGCLMEGISQEAATLAGHLKLAKLIVLFDDNHISIDGPTSLATSDDQIKRFEAAGWDTFTVDGHDPEEVKAAIAAARGTDRPSLIACRTIIGYGAPRKQGSASTHGAPLGAEEVQAAREELGWPHDPFVVPDNILAAWRVAGARSIERASSWFQHYMGHPRHAELARRLARDLPDGFDAAVCAFKRRIADEKPKVATRQASQAALEIVNSVLSETVGGSADLTGSNNTRTAEMTVFAAHEYSGRYIHYGVREHAMAAAMNGIALHGGFLPYGGTFLVFTDYCRPAIRLSALMRQRVVYVMTHDSIGLGEDGPTHQPVEHLAALRAIPNLTVFRPADAVETMECWALAAASKDAPSVIALTRQSVPTVRTEHVEDNLSARGAYEMRAAGAKPQVTLLATGSEVALAIDARDRLEEEGIGTRVVSIPSFELFEKQPVHYREEVLGKDTLRIGIEAGVSFGWDRYLGPDGVFIGMRGFGESAPYLDLYRHFGITVEAVVTAVKDRLGK